MTEDEKQELRERIIRYQGLMLGLTSLVFTEEENIDLRLWAQATESATVMLFKALSLQFKVSPGAPASPGIVSHRTLHKLAIVLGWDRNRETQKEYLQRVGESARTFRRWRRELKAAGFIS